MSAAASYSKGWRNLAMSNEPVTQNVFVLKGNPLKMSSLSLPSEPSGISDMPIYKEQQSAPQILAILQENKVKVSHWLRMGPKMRVVNMV